MAIRNYPKAFNLATATAATATAAATAVMLPEYDNDNIVLKFNVTSVSGTSPTLDLYVQSTDDGGTTWYDSIHFAQITASTANPHWAVLPAISDTAVIGVVGSKTISASAVGVPLLSRNLKVTYTIGGTLPSFAFTVDALVNEKNRGGN